MPTKKVTYKETAPVVDAAPVVHPLVSDIRDMRFDIGNGDLYQLDETGRGAFILRLVQRAPAPAEPGPEPETPPVEPDSEPEPETPPASDETPPAEVL